MDHSETISRWKQSPVWNGKAETWDDWGREVTLRTDSFDAKQASRLVRSVSHLPSVRSRTLSSTGGTREEHRRTLLTALRHLWPCVECADGHMRRKIGSEGFVANGIRLIKHIGRQQALSSRDTRGLKTVRRFHEPLHALVTLPAS